MSTLQITEEVTAAQEKAKTYKRLSQEYFVRFIDGGNDADRLMGNKWAACAVEQEKTAKRIESIANA